MFAIKNVPVSPVKDNSQLPNSPSNKRVKLEQEVKYNTKQDDVCDSTFSTISKPGSTILSYGPLSSEDTYEGRRIGATGGSAKVLNVDSRLNPSTFRFMMETLDAKTQALNRRIVDFAEELIAADPEAFGGILSQSVAGPTQDPVWVVGRVVPKADASQLTEAAVFLEGCREASHGATVALHLGSMPSYRVFPGQVLAAYGVNPQGTCVYAQRLVTSLPLPPRTPLSLSEDHAPDASAGCRTEDPAGCNMVVAAGPYTYAEDLSYEPLEGLLAQCSAAPPDLLVLAGPFLDLEHPVLLAGALDITFEQLMYEKVTQRLADWTKKHPGCSVALLPGGARDIAALPVFPQPPKLIGLDAPAEPSNAKTIPPSASKTPPPVSSAVKNRNTAGAYATATSNKTIVKAGVVTVVPNPAVLETSTGTTLALSSADILKALSAGELSRGDSMANRLSRASLACHVLQQRSFYPLYPPALGTCLDTTLYDAADLGITPDLLVLLSDLAPFVKPLTWTDQIKVKSEKPADAGASPSPADAAGADPVISLAVNPGRIVHGGSGGTYARISVLPGRGPAFARTKVELVRL